MARLRISLLLFLISGVFAGKLLHWCPDDCQLPHYSPLCQKRWLFIISTGRSGSTTLLHALKSANGGMHLVGETNIMGDLRQVYESSIQSFAPQNLTILLELQRLYYLINCPVSSCQSSVIYGGKEVHLSPLDINFLKVLFPCSRYILNIRRDAVGQSKSAFHKHHTASELHERNSFLINLHRTWLNKIRGTYLIAMEDFSSAAFNNLLSWLGYRDCQFEYVGHFNRNGTYELHSRPRLSGVCHLE